MRRDGSWVDAVARRLAQDGTPSRRDFLTGRLTVTHVQPASGAAAAGLVLADAEAATADGGTEGDDAETAARRRADPGRGRLRRIVEQYDDEMTRQAPALVDALVPRADGTADASAIRAVAALRGTVRRARKAVAELESPREARAQVLESLALTERSFDHFARVLQMTDENAREARMNRAVDLLKQGRQKGGVAARALGCGKRDCLVLR